MDALPRAFSWARLCLWRPFASFGRRSGFLTPTASLVVQQPTVPSEAFSPYNHTTIDRTGNFASHQQFRAQPPWLPGALVLTFFIPSHFSIRFHYISGPLVSLFFCLLRSGSSLSLVPDQSSSSKIKHQRQVWLVQSRRVVLLFSFYQSRTGKQSDKPFFAVTIHSVDGFFSGICCSFCS